MKKILLVVLAVVFAASSSAWAGDVTVAGYMAPNLKMIDKGEDNASNLGFGMAFNRFLFKGEMDGGAVVKKVAWRVESDISMSGTHKLQWAYVQPKFSDVFSLRLGHVKEPFSREILHSTPKLLTVDRHFSGKLSALGYGGFNYGLEAHVKTEMFKLQAGAYDGNGAQSKVGYQDPCIDFGLRGILTPSVEGLEIGANVMMVSLPNGGHGDGGTYADSDANELLTNSAMAFGCDLDYQKAFGEMSLWAQAEFETGDNWTQQDGTDPWDEAEFFSFQYLYAKALFMVSKDFGLHLGFSQYDPNTDGDAEGDSETLITPGVVYKWCKNMRTQAEVQLHTYEGIDEDVDYTHFVLQTIFIWP
ncbi:MAG: hypothetical protein KAY24_14575 [Candidatus Eisenbacteria sp.]|nr:hypothetical protein [Candidatus Eisenbacteria bacterium]